MDVKDIATYGTAVAVIGTGTVVGGNTAIDRYTGGPEKRIQATYSKRRSPCCLERCLANYYWSSKRYAST